MRKGRVPCRFFVSAIRGMHPFGFQSRRPLAELFRRPQPMGARRGSGARWCVFDAHGGPPPGVHRPFGAGFAFRELASMRGSAFVLAFRARYPTGPVASADPGPGTGDLARPAASSRADLACAKASGDRCRRRRMPRQSRIAPASASVGNRSRRRTPSSSPS
jgi:hypothetical protein